MAAAHTVKIVRAPILCHIFLCSTWNIHAQEKPPHRAAFFVQISEQCEALSFTFEFFRATMKHKKEAFIMATTTMTVRMDADVKHDAEVLCKEMGMTLSTAFNIFAKAMIRKRGIPFAVTGNPSLYDEPNRSHLRAAMDELNAGHGVEHALVDKG